MANDAERTTFKYLGSSVCVDCLACFCMHCLPAVGADSTHVFKALPIIISVRVLLSTHGYDQIGLAHIAASHTACVTQVGPLRYMISAIL